MQGLLLSQGLSEFLKSIQYINGIQMGIQNDTHNTHRTFNKNPQKNILRSLMPFISPNTNALQGVAIGVINAQVDATDTGIINSIGEIWFTTAIWYTMGKNAVETIVLLKNSVANMDMVVTQKTRIMGDEFSGNKSFICLIPH